MVSISFLAIKSGQKKCWGCGSNNVIKWGIQKGKQRYKCKQCGLLFTWQNKGVTQANYFEWFRRWVLQKDTLDILSKESGYSKRKLQLIFDGFLNKAPAFIVHSKHRLSLIIDGTYFSDSLCLVLYYDSKLRYSLLYRYSTNEFYGEIKEDLENLKKLGIDIASVTCDGKKAIIRAVNVVYPDAIVQRCTVHVQRMVRAWLTRRPKMQASRELRYLIGLLHHIKGMVEMHMWIIAFETWYKRHQALIEEKVLRAQTGRWWYKHRQLRRAAVSGSAQRDYQ